MIKIIFDRIISKYKFIFRIDTGISEPLSFNYKLCDEFKIVEIVYDFPKQRYYLKYEIYLEKVYQFTFDDKFNIKEKQKSKFLKLEDEICSIIERSLLNTKLLNNLFGD